MGVRIQELPETTGIKKEDVLIVEDGQGTKKGTVQQLDETLGVSQLKEDLIDVNEFLSSIQLFNKTNIVANKALTTYGTLIDFDEVSVSDYINIENVTELVATTGLGSNINGHCFYDKHYNYISGIGSSNINDILVFDVPKGAKYIRCTVDNEKINDFMLMPKNVTQKDEELREYTGYITNQNVFSRGDIIFDRTVMNVGDIVAYKLTAETGSAGHINLLDSSGNAIASFGKLSSSNLENTYEGFFEIPENFYKAIVVCNSDANVTINYIEKGINNKAKISSLERKITDTVGKKVFFGYNFIDISRTQHGENMYIRIPAICVMDNDKTLVLYEVREGARYDEQPSNIGYSIVNKRGEVERYGYIEERNDGEHRQVNVQAINDNGVVRLIWTTMDNNDNYMIHVTTSNDFGITWNKSSILLNTKINNDRIITAPANPVKYNDKLVVPIYSVSTDNVYHSGIMLLNINDNTFVAKVCDKAGTNECACIVNGDDVVLSCRLEDERNRYIYTTKADADTPFTRTFESWISVGQRPPVQETLRKFNNDTFLVRVTSDDWNRKNVTVFHTSDEVNIVDDMILSEYNVNVGGYSALDYNGRIYSVCCENSYDGNWGTHITVCNMFAGIR